MSLVVITGPAAAQLAQIKEMRKRLDEQEAEILSVAITSAQSVDDYIVEACAGIRDNLAALRVIMSAAVRGVLPSGALASWRRGIWARSGREAQRLGHLSVGELVVLDLERGRARG